MGQASYRLHDAWHRFVSELSQGLVVRMVRTASALPGLCPNETTAPYQDGLFVGRHSETGEPRLDACWTRSRHSSSSPVRSPRMTAARGSDWTPLEGC